MNKTLRKLGLIGNLIGGLAGAVRPVQAEDLESTVNTPAIEETQKNWGINVDTSRKGQYLFPAGFVLEDVPVVQSSVSGNIGGLYGYLWNNYNLERGKSTEYDAGFGHAWNVNLPFVGNLDYDASYNFFDLRDRNGADDNMHELWVTLSKQVERMTPGIKFVQNLESGSFENEKGRDIDFRVDGELPIPARWIPFVGNKLPFDYIPLKDSEHVHYNDNYFIEGRGLSIYQSSLSLPFSVRGINFNPSVTSQIAIDRDNFDDEIVLGLSASYGF